MIMTTEEKLEHFQSFCIQDARIQSEKIIDEYSAELERQLDDHKEDAQRHAQMQLQLESEKITHEMNKRLAIEQLNIKRILNQKHEELKKKLFVDVQDLLENYMGTAEYEQLLRDQVKQAKEIAQGEELVIYMDPVDSDKVRRVSLDQNINISISEYSFLGGMRAVIPSKNILIDHSFSSKLEEAKRSFQFHINSGGAING